MSVQNIAKTVYTGHAESIAKTSSTTSSAAGLPAGAASPSGSDSLDISKPAEFLNKLAQLQASDPAKFRETMSKSAGQLRLAAKAMQMQAVNQMLSGFAAQFDEAAESGSLDDSESAETNPYAGLQNPLAQYALQGQGQTSLASLLAAVQPQLKSNPKLQELFDKVLNSIDTAGSANVDA